MTLARRVVQWRMSQRVAYVHERAGLEEQLSRAERAVERRGVQRCATRCRVEAVREPARDGDAAARAVRRGARGEGAAIDGG